MENRPEIYPPKECPTKVKSFESPKVSRTF